MGRMRISKEVEFDLGHRVPNHASKCRNVHGHRYRVRAWCEGEVVSETDAADVGMLVDFGDLKAWLTEYVHDPLDHGFAYEASDPVGDAIAGAVEGQKLIPMWGPPTAENLVVWVWQQLEPVVRAHWRDNLELVLIELWETPTSLVQYEGGRGD